MVSLAIFIVFVAGVLMLWLRIRIEIKKNRQAIKVRKKSNDYIYFFRGKWENPFLVKIGRAKDPVQRLRAHRTANPHGIHLYAVICVKDDVRAETLIHDKFDRERINSRNEWFRLTLRLWWYMVTVADYELTKRVRERL